MKRTKKREYIQPKRGREPPVIAVEDALLVYAGDNEVFCGSDGVGGRRWRTLDRRQVKNFPIGSLFPLKSCQSLRNCIDTTSDHEIFSAHSKSKFLSLIRSYFSALWRQYFIRSELLVDNDFYRGIHGQKLFLEVVFYEETGGPSK